MKSIIQIKIQLLIIITLFTLSCGNEQEPKPSNQNNGNQQEKPIDEIIYEKWIGTYEIDNNSSKSYIRIEWLDSDSNYYLARNNYEDRIDGIKSIKVETKKESLDSLYLNLSGDYFIFVNLNDELTLTNWTSLNSNKKVSTLIKLK